MVVKAFCHLRNAPCTFVINRIKNGWPLKETFKPDHKIIDSVTLDNTVSYKKVRDVMIRLTGDAVKFAKANQMHSKQKITKIRDGSFLFSIPEVPAEVVVPWILSQKDEAVPLEPPEIVEASRKGAQAIADRTSWRQPAWLILLSAQTVTPSASAVIHRSSVRVRQAPVRNFAGADGSSFGNAAWTLMLKKRIKMEKILDMVYIMT